MVSRRSGRFHTPRLVLAQVRKLRRAFAGQPYLYILHVRGRQLPFAAQPAAGHFGQNFPARRKNRARAGQAYKGALRKTRAMHLYCGKRGQLTTRFQSGGGQGRLLPRRRNKRQLRDNRAVYPPYRSGQSCSARKLRLFPARGELRHIRRYGKGRKKGIFGHDDRLQADSDFQKGHRHRPAPCDNLLPPGTLYGNLPALRIQRQSALPTPFGQNCRIYPRHRTKDIL